MTYEEQMNDHIGFIERELEYSRQLHEKLRLYLSKEWYDHKTTCIEYFSNLEKENKCLKAQIEKMKNCFNCKRRPGQQTNKVCKYVDICSADYDKWEMME